MCAAIFFSPYFHATLLFFDVSMHLHQHTRTCRLMVQRPRHAFCPATSSSRPASITRELHFRGFPARGAWYLKIGAILSPHNLITHKYTHELTHVCGYSCHTGIEFVCFSPFERRNVEGLFEGRKEKSVYKTGRAMTSSRAFRTTSRASFERL